MRISETEVFVHFWFLFNETGKSFDIRNGLGILSPYGHLIIIGYQLDFVFSYLYNGKEILLVFDVFLSTAKV